MREKITRITKLIRRSLFGFSLILLFVGQSIAQEGNIFDLSLDEVLDIEVVVASRVVFVGQSAGSMFDLSLDEVLDIEVVVASRVSTARPEAPGDVSVITREEEESMHPEQPKWMADRRSATVRIERKLPQPRSYIEMLEVSNGVVISSDGLIVTVAHGLGTGRVGVVFESGKRYQAKVVYRNDSTDIAFLKINSENSLPFAPVSFSTDKLGYVWAMGRDEYGKIHVDEGETIAQGVSLTSKKLNLVKRNSYGKKKPFSHFLALPKLMIHRAEVREGLSGGPLFNSHGELVAINFARADTQENGLSFSIPTSSFLGALSEFKVETGISVE